jgi:hypothetical protein
MKKPDEKKQKTKSANKTQLFLGLLLILVAFLCVVAVFYFLMNAQTEKLGEISTLKEQISVLNIENGLSRQKASELEQKVGRSLNMQRILEEADKIYDPAEKKRKEGYLWIDRETNTFLVTLGALNGLNVGSRLTVYDKTEKMGFVRVETALDVISYVQPVNKTMNDFAQDYYRVVFEE